MAFLGEGIKGLFLSKMTDEVGSFALTFASHWCGGMILSAVA